MKLLPLFLAILLIGRAMGDFPEATYTAAAISADTDGSLSRFLKGHGRIYISAEDYRGITILYNSAKEEFTCTTPIAYYQVYPWLSASHKDKTMEGWSPRPPNGTGSYHRDLGSLIGLLDHAGIPHKRINVRRTDKDSGSLLAVWNKLEAVFSMDDKKALIEFLREIYADYPPQAKVHVDIKQK